MNGTTWDRNGNFLACGIPLCYPNVIELIFGKSLHVSVRERNVTHRRKNKYRNMMDTFLEEETISSNLSYDYYLGSSCDSYWLDSQWIDNWLESERERNNNRCIPFPILDSSVFFPNPYQLLSPPTHLPSTTAYLYQTTTTTISVVRILNISCISFLHDYSPIQFFYPFFFCLQLPHFTLSQIIKKKNFNHDC